MKKTVGVLFFIVAVLLGSCAPAPQAAPIGIETIVAATYAAISAETAAAQVSFSPTPQDTATPTVTLVPTSTLTPTPTFIVPSLTPIPTMTLSPTPLPGRFACAFVSQSPKNQTVFSPHQEVKLSWTVTNIGSKEWIQADVKYFFLRGDKFYKREVYGIPYNVVTGNDVVMKIDLVAPRDPGSYEMIWAMRRGLNNVFCERTFKFKVE